MLGESIKAAEDLLFQHQVHPDFVQKQEAIYALHELVMDIRAETNVAPRYDKDGDLHDIIVSLVAEVDRQSIIVGKYQILLEKIKEVCKEKGVDIEQELKKAVSGGTSE